MNSFAGCSRILAAAACVPLLVGCGATEDDADEPFAAAPTPTMVLQGTVTGLGTRRPVVLQYNGTDVCINPAAPTGPRVECRFFGVLNQDSAAFSFGAIAVGTPYNITVKTQPFGKQCSVANGTGTLGAAPTSITVTCINDAAVPRYAVSGSVAAGVAALPNAKVMLTTEDGVRQFVLNGQTSFQFDQALFNSQTNLPVFGWTVSATFTGTDGKVNNCNVTAGTNVAADGNATTVPTGNVTNVQVTACTFPVNVAVAYSGTPAVAIGAGGVTLELRDPHTGNRAVLHDPVTGVDVEVPALNMATIATAAFPRQLLSNSAAIYDLVVTGQPAGQTCVVGGGSQLAQGSAVLLLNPADAVHGFFTAKNVRCRVNPVPASQLRGTYQQTSIVTSTAVPPVVTTTTNRNFLTFFADGTFLYGLHSTGAGCSANCGVEHGFYAWNAAAGTITFTPLTDTITGTNANRLSSSGAAASLTSVIKTGSSPVQITATFNATTNWLLTAPESINSQMTGAWTTADQRRVWVYEGSKYTGFHAGVNGLGNVQDACFALQDPNALSGFFSRRGNGTTCQLGNGPGSATNIFTLDIPSALTVPRLPEGHVGKWPQAGSNGDGRPSSPVLYAIVPGTPDQVTVQNTLHDGTPVDPPIVLYRMTPN